jgi:hypothetical protein
MSLSQLRPLEFGEILDGAFVLYRRHFRTFFGVGMLAHTLAFATWIASPGLEHAGLRHATVRKIELSFAMGGWEVGAAACCLLTSAAYLGGNLSTGRAFRSAASRIPSLAAAFVLKMAALLVGFVLLVAPMFFAAQETFGMTAAMMLEGKGAIEAVRRSSALATGARLHVLAVVLTLLVVEQVPLYTTAWGTAWLWPRIGLHLSPYTLATTGVAVTLVRALVLPLPTIGAVILYYDRRVRTEALDLAPPAAAPAFAVAG